jgi:hypothetical protein
VEVTEKKQFPVSGFPLGGIWRLAAAKEGSQRKNCASEDQEFGCDMLCPIQEPKWKSSLKKGISHEAQKQAHDCDSHGSARRPRRRGRLRAGQVLAEIAERNRVFRLQGIRGLGGGLFRPDRRSAQGDRRSKRFPKSGGWGYAVFNYEAASDKFTADPKSLSDCGHACHTAVKAKDYIFHPYQKR